MPSNKQRRESERLRLQRQLDQRREREVARRRTTLILSIVVALALVGGVVAVIAVYTGGNSSTPTAGGGGGSGHASTPTAPPTTPSTAASTPAPSSASSSPVALAAPKACAKPPKGSTATFDGVTVKGATDLTKQPKVTSKSSSVPNALACQDLVVGKGKPAGATSTVSVRYTGVLYTDGKVFDSSYLHGTKPLSFALNRVIPGFTQGIGGSGKVTPMRVGGRRVMILPPSLAYGSQSPGAGIPPNSTLVFVVDLVKVTG